jgi:hypothetical protein
VHFLAVAGVAIAKTPATAFPIITANCLLFTDNCIYVHTQASFFSPSPDNTAILCLVELEKTGFFTAFAQNFDLKRTKNSRFCMESAAQNLFFSITNLGNELAHCGVGASAN